jgi:exopolyphosphatase/pppGpp-phosphohydrolase
MWLTSVVAGVALVLSVVAFIIGCVDLYQSWNTNKITKDAIKNAAEVSKTSTASAEELQKQSAIDFKGTWEALGKLATALKDLDRSSRLFVISLAFLAVAAAAAGAGEISNAIAST